MNSSPASNSGHLIIVCCHAIWLGGLTNGSKESEWLLAPFHAGETPCFIEHIQAGLRTLASSTDGLLVFSGGQTRPETPLSESQSYFNLAASNNYWSLLPSVSQPPASITTEPHSLDSYQNLLFSLLTFYKIRSKYPSSITIISHSFKRKRFLELCCKALGLQEKEKGGRVEFLGIEPEYMREGAVEWDEVKAGIVRDGERERGYDAWARDLYGKGEFLRGKREGRNYWKIDQNMVVKGLGEDVRALWEWEGKGLFKGKLPWRDEEVEEMDL